MNRWSTSSADSTPPPPCPITIFGELRSGIGQAQPSKSSSTNGARLPDRRGAVEPSIQVVGRAGTLGADHGRSQRSARCALLAERAALVRLDQALHCLLYTSDAADEE